MRTAAQALVDSIQRSLSKYGRMNRWDRLLLRAKFALRRVLLPFRDPPVKYQLGSSQLLLPFSHNLWIDDSASPGRTDNLARIAERVQKYKGDLCFVDVGANVGDTIAVLRNRCHFPILAVEGDDQFYPYLESNMKSFSDVWTFKALLSDCSGELRGTLMTNYGGSKQVTVSSDANAVLRFSTLPEVVDQFPSFRQTKMIKIDTDGYDCKIIRGALPWLAETRPVIFFEYDPHHLAEQGDDGMSIFGELRGIGYQGVLVFEGNGEFMSSLMLEETRLIEELHRSFLAGPSRRYADLCVFHSQDNSLFEECRIVELNYASAVRMGKQPE